MKRRGDEMREQPWPHGAYRPEGDSITPSDGRIGRMIMDQLVGIPDDRTELIGFLRRAIEEDRYYVPEELVAERMIYHYRAGNVP